MADNTKETLYHHTTREGAMQILQSGYIKQSDTKTDAAYGPGTYMTSHGPDKSQSDIARNNYDGYQNQYADQMLKAGKTDATIAVDIPRSQVYKAPSDRNIYVAPGDVTLQDKNPRFYMRDGDGKAKEYKQVIY